MGQGRDIIVVNNNCYCFHSCVKILPTYGTLQFAKYSPILDLHCDAVRWGGIMILVLEIRPEA